MGTNQSAWFYSLISLFPLLGEGIPATTPVNNYIAWEFEGQTDCVGIFCYQLEKLVTITEVP